MRDTGTVLADILAVAMGIVLLALCASAYSDGVHGLLVELFCAVVCFVPAVCRRVGIVSLPGTITFLIALAVFLHAFGLLSGAYDDVSYFDTITHTLSSAVVGLLVFYALITIQHFGGGRVNFEGRGLAAFTALIALTFSVYWEVIEYCSDMITGSVTQYSPYDTLTDLVCDFLGNIIASVFVGIYMSRRSPKDLVESFEIHPKIKFLAFTDRTGKE